MTIGRERYGNMEPPHVRRGLAFFGLALVALSIPLMFPLGSLAAVVAVAGGIALIYAVLPSSYPLLGVFVVSVLTSAAFGVFRWIIGD